MIRKLAVASALTLAAAVSAPAHAQLPFRLGVQAGVTTPTGDLGDVQGTGYHVGLLAEVKPIALPLGFRADLTFHELDTDDDAIDVIGFDPGALRILNVNGNAIFTMPGIGLSPYLIGGIGWYRTYYAEADDSDSNDFGFNVGGGIRFGLSGFTAAIEARYHRVSFGDDEATGQDLGSAQFIPISFVLTF